MRAGGDEDGGIARLLEAADGDVRRASAKLDAQLDLNPVIENLLDLVVEHVARQAVGRHAQAKHAAEERTGLEQSDAVALLGQIPGRRQAGRTATDDGDFLPRLHRERNAVHGIGIGPGRIGEPHMAEFDVAAGRLRQRARRRKRRRL